MLSAGTVASGAATTSATPRAEATKRLNTLVKHTRTLPKRLVKRRHKVALLRLAKAARRSSRRNPCRSIRTLRSYRRRLKRVRRPRVRGRAPTTSSRRGQLESDTLAANVALLALPRARRCGGKRVSVAQVKADVVESDERHLRLQVSLPLPTFAAHQVGGSEYQQMFMEGMGETGDEGKPGLPILGRVLRRARGRRRVRDGERHDGLRPAGREPLPAPARAGRPGRRPASRRCPTSSRTRS